MRFYLKLLSFITTITVTVMVLFGIFCPQLSMQKMDHSACSGSAKMTHVSEAVGGCLGLHSQTDNLPSILPDLAIYLMALSVLLFAFKYGNKTFLILSETAYLIRSRLRFIYQFFELRIKPLFAETFLAWLSFSAEHIPAVNL